METGTYLSKVFVTPRWALVWSEWREWSMFWTNAGGTTSWKIIWLVLRFSCFQQRVPWHIISTSKSLHSFHTSRGRHCKWERAGQDSWRTQVNTWLIPVSIVCAFCKSVSLWSPNAARSDGVWRVRTVSSRLESRTFRRIFFVLQSNQVYWNHMIDVEYPICWFGGNSCYHAKPIKFSQAAVCRFMKVARLDYKMKNKVFITQVLCLQ